MTSSNTVKEHWELRLIWNPKLEASPKLFVMHSTWMTNSRTINLQLWNTIHECLLQGGLTSAIEASRGRHGHSLQLKMADNKSTKYNLAKKLSNSLWNASAKKFHPNFFKFVLLQELQLMFLRQDLLLLRWEQLFIFICPICSIHKQHIRCHSALQGILWLYCAQIMKSQPVHDSWIMNYPGCVSCPIMDNLACFTFLKLCFWFYVCQHG